MVFGGCGPVLVFHDFCPRPGCLEAVRIQTPPVVSTSAARLNRWDSKNRHPVYDALFDPSVLPLLSVQDVVPLLLLLNAGGVVPPDPTGGHIGPRTGEFQFDL